MDCRRTPLTLAFAVVALVVVMAVGWIARPAGARNRGADGKWSDRSSQHFVLLQDVAIDRYSGLGGSRQFERQVLDVLEHAYDEVRDALGVSPRRKLRAIVFDPNIFDAEYASRFGFRAAGFYNGAIHIRGGTRLDSRMVRTLHHEYVHAALDALAPGAFPAWMNEGLAEYFERRALGRRVRSSGEQAALAQAAAQGHLFRLDQLSGASFAGLDSSAANIAYLQSYAFIEFLARRHGEDRLERLCENVARTRDPAKAVVRTFRDSLAELEAAMLAELR